MQDRRPRDNRVCWVDKRDRMPAKADCDAWGCVLIYDRYNGVMVTGYLNRQQLDRHGVTHWARIPAGPEGEKKQE